MSYNNRLSMGIINRRSAINKQTRTNIKSENESMDSQKGQNSSRDPNGSIFGNKEDSNQIGLYCINVRANSQCADLAIRRLTNHDNLLSIEFQNKLVQQFYLRKIDEFNKKGRINEIDLIRSQIPVFKYIYCSPIVIKQIETAFENNEVSFSSNQVMLDQQSTIIKYNINFLNNNESGQQWK